MAKKARRPCGCRAFGWLRGKDLNLRPSGYEPDELPGCSTPRQLIRADGGGPARPGDDLLFRALRRSTIGAEGFHGRVRDGIGCFAPRYGHQAVQALPVRRHRADDRGQTTEGRRHRSEIEYQKSDAGSPRWVFRSLLSEEASCAVVFWRGLPPWLSALPPQHHCFLMILAAGCGARSRSSD